MELQLQYLVENALLEHAEMGSREVSIHDLYREFAEWEARGNLKSSDMEERRWVYAMDAVPPEMEGEPRSNWKMVTRVCIFETCDKIMDVRAIEWKYFTNLVVLTLDSLSELSGVLNFKDLRRLRSLTVVTPDDFPGHELSIEGLEGLRNLTYFQMINGFDHGNETQVSVGKLPAALKVLEITSRYPVGVEREFLALCTNLVSLSLTGLHIAELDLKSYTSLERLGLENLDGFKVLKLGPNLQTVYLCVSSELVEFCGLDRLPGLLSLTLKTEKHDDDERDIQLVLERDVLALCTNLVLLELRGVRTSELDLKSCPSLEKLYLLGVKGLEVLKLGPNLQSVDISWCSELVEVCGLHRPLGLLSLNLRENRKLSKLSNLSGLKCLHTLACDGLGIDEVPGLDALVGLISLTLRNCPRLSKLPNLSGLKRLHTLACDGLGIDEVPGLDGLVGLTSLTLRDCGRLSKLPSLTWLHSLQKLSISGLGTWNIPAYFKIYHK